MCSSMSWNACPATLTAGWGRPAASVHWLCKEGSDLLLQCRFPRAVRCLTHSRCLPFWVTLKHPAVGRCCRRGGVAETKMRSGLGFRGASLPALRSQTPKTARRWLLHDNDPNSKPTLSNTPALILSRVRLMLVVSGHRND